MRKLIPLTDPSQIPENMTEAEAAEFWNTHEITDAYLAKAGEPDDNDPHKRTQKVSDERPEKTEDGFTIIYDPDDIPEFASDAEEVVYWESHAWSDKLMDEAAKLPRNPHLPPPRERGQPLLLRPVSLEFDRPTTERLRSVAKKQRIPYTRLLKQFVLERLDEEEKREGSSL